MKYVEYGKEVVNMLKQSVKGVKHERLKIKEKVSSYTEQINELGYVVIPDYYSKEKCQKIIPQIDELLIKYKDQLWPDKLNSDKRLFAANRVNDMINEFYTDPYINQIKQSYYKRKNITGFTLAARIDAVEGNLGSGQGWHRDSIYGRQLKAILYLTDVSTMNGPFQYIPKTHKSASKLEAILKADIKAGQNRLSEEIVTKVLSLPEYELMECTFKAGTLMLVDTTAIHRGKPLEQDHRYALTNYWFIGPVPKHIEEFLVSN